MKLIYKLFLLVFVISTVVSCQNEINEVITPPAEEVLKANSTAANLIKRTATFDGSKDNIVDNASCLSIKLPFTVVVNGIEVYIDSEEDYEVIEDIFDEFDDDSDILNLIFPIKIILSDFSEITISNADQFEDYVEDCLDENEIDDDIECLDFVYPITLSIYNSNNQLADTVTVENDEQFYHFIDEVEDYHIVQINFPISVVLYDGTQKTVNSISELENLIESVDDMCDEDDDNDYDDDDCANCSTQQITELLMECSWLVDKLKINNQDQTEQYEGFYFTFKAGGLVLASKNGNIIEGTWEIVETANGIVVKLNFANLPDFSFNWRLYEIEENNEIDLRIDDNRLEFEKICTEDKTQLLNALQDGLWVVAHFNDNNTDITANFNDFKFDFKENFTVTATKTNDVFTGEYSVYFDSGKLKLEFEFGDVSPFDELNEDFKVLDIQTSRVEIKDIDSSTGKYKIVVFEKL